MATIGIPKQYGESAHRPADLSQSEYASLGLYLYRPEELSALFNELAIQWRRETGHMSSTTRKYMHPAYQTIIGMGKQVLPLVLTELRSRPSHWFWALRFIAHENPAADCKSVEAATEAWINWGIGKGYVDP